MGAKFTIVLDTDDHKGLRDALDIAILLNKSAGNPSLPKATLSKIQLIKLVRLVAKEVRAEKMDDSLRASKEFVDGIWHDLTTSGRTPDYIR